MIVNVRDNPQVGRDQQRSNELPKVSCQLQLLLSPCLRENWEVVGGGWWGGGCVSYSQRKLQMNLACSGGHAQEASRNVT